MASNDAVSAEAPASSLSSDAAKNDGEVQEILSRMETGDYYIKVGKAQQVLSAIKRGKALIYVQGATSKKRRGASKGDLSVGGGVGKALGAPRKLHPYNLYMKTRVREIKEQQNLKHPEAFKQAAKEWKEVESKKSSPVAASSVAVDVSSNAVASDVATSVAMDVASDVVAVPATQVKKEVKSTRKTRAH